MGGFPFLLIPGRWGWHCATHCLFFQLGGAVRKLPEERRGGGNRAHRVLLEFVLEGHGAKRVSRRAQVRELLSGCGRRRWCRRSGGPLGGLWSCWALTVGATGVFRVGFSGFGVGRRVFFCVCCSSVGE
jgi:hypothetical protein